MGILKYKICDCCKLTLPATRLFFKRSLNKETNKEEYHSACKNCEEKILIEKNWMLGSKSI